MDKPQKQRLIATNAAVPSAGMLASFVLPRITDSLVDGRGDFLRMLAHVFPLVCATAFSCGLIARVIPDSPVASETNP